MAAERVQDSQREAITKCCSDMQWKELESVIGIGVQRRLATVDRSLFASNQIMQMLNQDRLGKNDARDEDGVIYQGFSAVEEEALTMAMIELGSCAQEALAQVRDNDSGCWGRLLKIRDGAQS
ncbi:hypothetical protein HDE78_000244 [Rhodanobacter sp. K2T2]|uniref:hypothetical protein n=1 Tax=Rhodanobacter sp. K2T2 TaxID=2723085 RepID=UPI0015CE7ED7|nr:hypothetical protein [Rhodanobacter sp. K2T2]NYE27319.1 hypothetical protein [Rhodanobacter sp. K2T2]